jgi:predicted acyltransferase
MGKSASNILEIKKPRLLSLDALRGFDMLMIIGFAEFMRTMADASQCTWLKLAAGQLEHVQWQGFHCYDLIFPLFLFIVGVAIPFSLYSKSQQDISRKQVFFRVFRRMILLVLLGILYNGALKFSGFHDTRFASVLGHIGIGYFFASLIVLNFSFRNQVLWFLGILLGYWALLMLVPVPGFGAGVLTPEGCLPAYIDRLLLPSRLHGGIYDPEGIMSAISGISTALAGAFAGQLLRKENITQIKKAGGLFIAGITFILIALVWSKFLPFIKNIWSGSFVMLTAGMSSLLLGTFYFIIDVLEWKKWAFVFTVIGMNSITIYIGSKLIDFKYTADFIFGGTIKSLPELYQKPFLYLAILILEWLLLYALYRKKIFLRL